MQRQERTEDKGGREVVLGSDEFSMDSCRSQPGWAEESMGEAEAAEGVGLGERYLEDER